MKRKTGATLLLISALWLSSVARAAAPLTLEEYRQVIEQTIQLLDLAMGRADVAQRESLARQAADKLEAVGEVKLASGEIVSLNNEALFKPLREPSPSAQSLRDVRARLQALRAALGDSPAQLTDAERDKLREVFNRPPFVREPNWLEEWINELLRALFRNAINGVFDMRELITLLGGVLVALVVIYFVRSLRFNSAAESVLPVAAVNDEANLTSVQALNRAEQLAGAGNYRAAVRQLYLSTLLLLDERGRLRYDRSLTNREYLRAVANTPLIADALRPVVDTFDSIWYGFAPINTREFEAYRQQVERVREL